MPIPQTSLPRYKAMLFPDMGFLAHTSRLLEIAKVLRRDYACEVRFAGGGPYARLVREAGFEVDETATIDREIVLSLARRAGFVDPIWYERLVRGAIRADAEAIRAWKPDVVVGDMHWSLGPAAHECGVPHASVINASWTRHFSHNVRPIEGHFITRALGRTGARYAQPMFQEMALWYWSLPFKAWRVLNGMWGARTGNIYDIVEGDITLLADAPEFCPSRDLPENVRYIGPILWEPEMPTPPWMREITRGPKTIYISMGSTGHVEVFEAALEAFADTDYRVVITTGDLRLAALDKPKNFFVTDFSPGLPLMRRADVSLNHGGSGTVYQALTAGTPVVGVPQHFDQQIQLQLCEDAGVGMTVHRGPNLTANLRDAVVSVLEDPAYRERARVMERAIARWDGPRLGAAGIDDLVQSRAGA